MLKNSLLIFFSLLSLTLLVYITSIEFDTMIIISVIGSIFVPCVIAICTYLFVEKRIPTTSYDYNDFCFRNIDIQFTKLNAKTYEICNKKREVTVHDIIVLKKYYYNLIKVLEEALQSKLIIESKHHKNVVDLFETFSCKEEFIIFLDTLVRSNNVYFLNNNNNNKSVIEQTTEVILRDDDQHKNTINSFLN